MKNRALTLSLTLACLSSMWLTGCGGGKQGEKFSPSNIVSFGDESSAFASEAVAGGTISGLKYTVNSLTIHRNVSQDLKTALTPAPNPPDPSAAGLKPLIAQTGWIDFVNGGTASFDAAYKDQLTRVLNLDTLYTTPTTAIKADVTYQYAYLCPANRIWIQILADSYGMSYSNDCLLDVRGRAQTFATAGAKVADVVTQISSNMSKISKNTLVTVLAGQNDILEKFNALYSGGTPNETAVATAASQLTALGRTLGSAINPIANIGARTLVVYVPDLSYSPKVVGDAAKAAVMKRLVVAFNDGLFSDGGARNDGTVIGLVDAFRMVGLMVQSPSSYSLINVKDPACLTTGRSIDTTSSKTIDLDATADLKYCNDRTLFKGDDSKPTAIVPAATASNYLWANNTLLSPAGHSQMSGIAFSRADNDTF